MDEQASAIIIPFPARHRAELAQSTERLAEALTSLSAALAEQREATQRWRTALAALSNQIQAVGTPPR